MSLNHRLGAPATVVNYRLAVAAAVAQSVAVAVSPAAAAAAPAPAPAVAPALAFNTSLLICIPAHIPPRVGRQSAMARRQAQVPTPEAGSTHCFGSGTELSWIS